MPREVKAYACLFRCGRRVTVKKESMEEHEKHCFMNPEKRACKTCSHEAILSALLKYRNGK